MIHMPKQIWIFAGILTALFLGAVGFLQVREATRERATALSAAAAATALAEAHSRTNSLLAAELEHLRAQAAELEKQVQQAAADRSSLETQMRSELESRDITISELQGKLTINILDRVLFDSGEAELKPEGQQVLLKLAQILQQHTNRQVQVIGHTDNVPIHSRTRGGFTDNWSLSAGRATAAVRFLQEQARVEPRRLAAVGLGEFRPIADNATAEGRARNRRIAVVILPEEIVPTDAEPKRPASTPGTNAPTATTPIAPPVP
jgi:chemotaxis protein MotB